MTELPPAFIERARAELGEDFAPFCAALVEGAPASGLRVNPLKLSPADLVERTGWALDPVPWAPGGFSVAPDLRPGATALHAAGAFYVQEPSAMAVGAILDPRPGERVLDLAAAPGGKTTDLAARLRGEGLLVANEVHPARVRKLLNNVERWGAPTVVTSAEVGDLARRWPRAFDRVLLDAPCSGEGMFRKDPEAARAWRPHLPARLAGTQRDLLRGAARLVRPGGVVVYSTCTFSREENEGVVEDFLARHAGWTLEDARLDPAFEPVLGGAVRLWPHRLRGEGHFVARLRAPGDAPNDGAGAEDDADLPEPSREARRLWEAFADEHLLARPPGTLTERAGHLYAVPNGVPDLGGVRCPAPGLYLGEARTGRFVPARALAQWAGPSPGAPIAARVLDLDARDPRWSPLDRGEAVAFDGPGGWHLVAFGGVPLTWGAAKKGALRPTKARL